MFDRRKVSTKKFVAFAGYGYLVSCPLRNEVLGCQGSLTTTTIQVRYEVQQSTHVLVLIFRRYRVSLERLEI